MPVERSCVICRKKARKEEFFRLCESKESYCWDKNGKKQARGYYVCKAKDCLARLAKHKKIKVKIQDLYEMAKEEEKENLDYINILKTMKQGNVLSFGMKMVLEEINHVHFLIIAKDIAEKYARQLELQARGRNIPFQYFGTKKELATLFGKEEVTVVAINDKKMARGLINKMK